MSTFFIAKIQNMFLPFWQKTLTVCCGNGENHDCVETASNCVDLWPFHSTVKDQIVESRDATVGPYSQRKLSGKLSVRTLTTISSL